MSCPSPGVPPVAFSAMHPFDQDIILDACVARSRKNHGLFGYFTAVRKDQFRTLFNLPFHAPEKIEVLKGGADWYAEAVAVAKAVCVCFGIICPLINNLPTE